MMILAAPIIRLNLHPMWRRPVHLWGSEMVPITLDRLVCIWLHRLGVMGRGTQTLFASRIQTGMRVVDIGANQALYTLLFSSLVGESGIVYAFEPDPELFASAEANCRRNNVRNVRLYPVALGDVDGSVTLSRSLLNAGDNRLSGRAREEVERKLNVQVRRFETVVEDSAIDFIKIDVQGWEFHVFRGMERLLAGSRPLTIYFEYWPAGLRSAGDDARDVLEHLANRGFRIFTTAGAPISDFGRFATCFKGRTYTNLLATR